MIVVNGLNAEDIVGKPMRIDAKGNLTLPLIGTVHAGGLTIPKLEKLLNERLSVFVKNPQLIVSVSQYESQPVSVVGAVNNPGIHQIQGRKTIIEMISLAGGPRVDAGSTVTLTRSLEYGPLPLPNEHLDPTGRYSTATLSLRDITSGRRPGENIFVMPHDVLTISRASTVYVIGEVNKAGAFPIGDGDAVTVVQALSMAQGYAHTADTKHARIIRMPKSQANAKRSFAIYIRSLSVSRQISTCERTIFCTYRGAPEKKSRSRHWRPPLPPAPDSRFGASVSPKDLSTHPHESRKRNQNEFLSLFGRSKTGATLNSLSARGQHSVLS